MASTIVRGVGQSAEGVGGEGRYGLENPRMKEE